MDIMQGKLVNSHKANKSISDISDIEAALKEDEIDIKEPLSDATDILNYCNSDLSQKDKDVDVSLTQRLSRSKNKPKKFDSSLITTSLRPKKHIEHSENVLNNVDIPDPSSANIDQNDILSVCLIERPPNAKHYCALCRVDFPTENHLQDHFKSHDNPYQYNKSTTNYECSNCSAVYRSVESIEKHILSHCIRRFICVFAECSMRFTSKTDLLLNQNIHCKNQPEDSYVCLICSAAFKGLRMIQTHLKEHSFVCGFPDCPEESKTVVDLATHRASHCDITTVFSCPLCQSPEMNEYDLIAHVQLTEHVKYEILCGFCGHSSLNEVSHKTHKIEHYRNRYSCMVCDRKFTLSNSLLRHQVMKHPVEAEPGYFCKYCIREFDNDDKLTAHEGKCILDVPRTHKLGKKCKYLMAERVKILLGPNKLQYHHGFKGVPTLFNYKQATVLPRDTHTKTVRSEKEDFTSKCYACSTCTESFCAKIEVEEHIARNHPELAKCYQILQDNITNEEIFSCAVCDFSTKEKNNFRLHVLSFHKQYDIICKQCDKSFISKAQFRLHLSEHLSVKWRFPCVVCNEVFGTVSHLKQHQTRLHLVHTVPS